MKNYQSAFTYVKHKKELYIKMTQYANFKVNVSSGQVEEIKKAIQAGTEVSIRLSYEDLSGEHVLALTQKQINRIEKAYKNSTGVDIKMSKTQLQHNAKIKGGFIPLIICLSRTSIKAAL